MEKLYFKGKPLNNNSKSQFLWHGFPVNVAGKNSRPIGNGLYVTNVDIASVLPVLASTKENTVPVASNAANAPLDK